MAESRQPVVVNGATRPSNVGIKAMEIYFPSTYVSQEDLEVHDDVSPGKYTKGLAQSAMAFCNGREDINSVCLTVVHNLLEKFNIHPKEIGRLEVGTETMVDKSKAVKTTLMQLFQDHGNFDVEGIDSKNACYGGTSALLNSLAWVESSAWDGRYAVAVAGDIAVYEKGNARPTGGAGVVAMLIGPDAPLVVEPGLRASHFEDVWDFYKPTMVSEYPRVDGKLSNECYLRALEHCYQRYGERFTGATGQPFNLTAADYAIFHAPYNKLVQKAFGRFLWKDFLNDNSVPGVDTTALEPLRHITPAESYNSKDLINALKTISPPLHTSMVAPSELITKQCGNSYCGSLYAGLLSLITNKADELPGTRTLMFSYGSGLAASLFSVVCVGDVTGIRDKTDVINRLESRTPVAPSEFEAILEQREKEYTRFDYEPTDPVDHLFPGTYYLKSVDDMERRAYARALHTSARRSALPARLPLPRKATTPAAMPAAARTMARLAGHLGAVQRFARLIR
eukprot:m.483851 g.483851  ORF g.483851 m.483851 type:complete len:509 (-) comp23096_c0_seq1:133-1659(-)